jgi:hypothetical protein
MIEAISAAGTSATWQARVAAMQQQLTQNLFQSADTNGDGSISKSEFEAFYDKFMGANSQTQASQTAAADQLFQQFDTQGTGQLNATQFAAALKQMIAQQPQGHHGHHHRGVGAVGAAAQGASQSNAASASGNPAALFSGLVSSAPAQNAATASAQAQAGSLEFIA